jgi:FMN phosphatase YigB (HAD superfamily)
VIDLIVLDAGHTLGVCTGPDTTDVLASLSGLPRELVAETERRLLHREPLTEKLIAELCYELHIDPLRWPLPWPPVGFHVYDYVPDTLAELATIARTVVLSNMDSASGPPRIHSLNEQCDPHIAGLWTSYGLGSRKPDPRLWRHLADVYEVDPRHVVHIGDSWWSDIHGAVRAGCHAIYLETREPAPDLRTWPDGMGRITVAPNLQHAVADVVAFHRGQD